MRRRYESEWRETESVCLVVSDIEMQNDLFLWFDLMWACDEVVCESNSVDIHVFESKEKG